MPAARVLLVDNNRLVVDLVGAFLTDLGYEVLRAYDGLEALDRVAVDRPDVVVTDLVMPRVDGKRLCRFLRQDPETASIPIIVLSGIASEDREGYREVEADAYLAKCAYDRLLPNIKETLERLHGARAELHGEHPERIVGIEEIYPRELVKEFTIIKKHYDAILENMAEGVVEIAPEGRIILSNPAAQLMLVRREEELVGRRLDAFFDDGHQEKVESAVEAFLQGRREPMHLRAAAGGRIMSLHLSPIVRASTFDGLFVTVADVTREVELEAAARDYTHRLELEVRARTAELERRNEELVQANRIKDEFLGVLSHELRTPITPIKGYIELLHDNMADPALSEKAFQVLKKQTEHLERLLTDLLDLTALEAGRMELASEELDANEVVKSVAAALLPQAQDRSLDLHVDLAPGELRATVDAARLEQVLRNLVGNAIKFSRDHARISVTTAVQNGAIVLSVEDQGIGIPEKDRNVIFERFRQVDGSLTRKYSGLGIGLTLAKRLVELMGGSIDVSSREGAGSRFTVTLPAGPAGAPPPVP